MSHNNAIEGCGLGLSIAQWIMNSDAVGPVSIDGRGEPPHDGMYDAADKMNVIYEFKNPDWTLIWAQPGEPSDLIVRAGDALVIPRLA